MKLAVLVDRPVDRRQKPTFLKTAQMLLQVERCRSHSVFHETLPWRILAAPPAGRRPLFPPGDFGPGNLSPANFPLPRSEEHTSELQSLMRISYAVFCLK